MNDGGKLGHYQKFIFASSSLSKDEKQVSILARSI